MIASPRAVNFRKIAEFRDKVIDGPKTIAMILVWVLGNQDIGDNEMTSNGHTITTPEGYPVLFPGFLGPESLAEIVAKSPPGTTVDPWTSPEAPRKMTAPEHELLSRKIGPMRSAWAYYQHWLRAYRHACPEDERGDFELIRVFEREMTQREAARRARDPKYLNLCN